MSSLLNYYSSSSRGNSNSSSNSNSNISNNSNGNSISRRDRASGARDPSLLRQRREREIEIMRKEKYIDYIGQQRARRRISSSGSKIDRYSNKYRYKYRN
mgnify:CR=1 FL=1